MAQTTLSVRLLQMSHTRLPSISRVLLISLFLFSGSLLSGCSSGEDSGDLARYALRDGDGQGSDCDELARHALQDGNCSGSGSGSANPTGRASASLSWDPVGGVVGYIIYYGTQSPSSPGSCAYTQSIFTSTPSAMVTGLAENTTYYFAVSSYNGLESACSAEVAAVPQSI